jgi:hypothetical protein
MAEEKSAPKKEKPAKPAAEGAPAAAAPPKRRPAPKAAADKAGKPADGAAPPLALRLRAAEQKPVEMVGMASPSSPRPKTSSRRSWGTIKVRKAKGSKNVTSGSPTSSRPSTTRSSRSPTRRGRSSPGLQRRQVQLPRFPQVHRLRRPGRRPGRRAQRDVAWTERRHHPRLRSRPRPRQRDPRPPGHRP